MEAAMLGHRNNFISEFNSVWRHFLCPASQNMLVKLYQKGANDVDDNMGNKFNTLKKKKKYNARYCPYLFSEPNI